MPRCQRTRTRRPARRPRAVCCTAARCAGAGSPSPPRISLPWRAPGHCRCSTASTSLLAAFCCCGGPNLDGRLPVGVPRVACQRTGGGAGGSGGDARRHGFVSQRHCLTAAIVLGAFPFDNRLGADDTAAEVQVSATRPTASCLPVSALDPWDVGSVAGCSRVARSTAVVLVYCCKLGARFPPCALPVASRRQVSCMQGAGKRVGRDAAQAARAGEAGAHGALLGWQGRSAKPATASDPHPTAPPPPPPPPPGLQTTPPTPKHVCAAMPLFSPPVFGAVLGVGVQVGLQSPRGMCTGPRCRPHCHRCRPRSLLSPRPLAAVLLQCGAQTARHEATLAARCVGRWACRCAVFKLRTLQQRSS